MKQFFVLIAVLFSSAIFAQEAPAVQGGDGEKEWSMALSMQYAGHYFDKGGYSNADPVLQGDVELSWKQLFVGATGFFDLTDQNDHENTFEEYDYTVGWRPVIGGDWGGFIQGLDCQVAYVHYVYPRFREDDSNEINLAVNAQCFLAPGVDFYWDFENDILYGNVNISHSIDLSDNLTLNMESQLCWGNRRFQERDYDVSRNSAVSVVGGVSVEYSVTESLKVTPYIQCGWALGKAMRNAWKDDEDQSSFNMNYGVALSWEF